VRIKLKSFYNTSSTGYRQHSIDLAALSLPNVQVEQRSLAATFYMVSDTAIEMNRVYALSIARELMA
jgi:hypothetical protein